MPKGGGPIETLVTGLSGANAIAFDATSVYWASSGVLPDFVGHVSKVSRLGGPVEILADVTRASGVVVDGTTVYTSGAAIAGGVLAIPVTGGASRSIAPDAGGLAMTSSATDLFFVSSYVVQRVDKQSGTTMTLFDANVGGSALALDATHVYWAFGGYWGGAPHPGAGKILRVLQRGGAVEEIAICQGKPAAIAVDANSVYWVNWVTGELMAAPK